MYLRFVGNSLFDIHGFMQDRLNRGVDEENYGGQLREIFGSKFELGFEPPVVFIDTHYNKSNPEEKLAFDRESEKLWRISLNRFE